MEMNYLRDLMRSSTVVKVITSNGFHMRGLIDDVGARGIILESEGKRKLVFYNSISTVEPEKERNRNEQK